uniref:Telomere length regulation protein TEL2 homolog n=1 Tax=Xiphophorus couchianus TaxID=32473 RepID=A0A3B5KWP1_9TELE
EEPDSEVRLKVAQCFRSLSSSADHTDVFDALETLNSYLDDGAESSSTAAEREEFRRTQYTRTLRVLVGQLQAHWTHSLSAAQRSKLWDPLFLKGPPDQALLVLMEAVTQLRGEFKTRQADGFNGLVLGVMAPRLAVCTRSDVVWQRVSWRLLQDVPERCMESVLTGLLQVADSSDTFSRIAGNLVLTNKKAQFVLTHKVLLLQYKYEVGQQLTVNILCIYIIVSQAWANPSAVKHTPQEQQLYVSKTLLLAASLLTDAELQELRSDLLQCLLDGMQSHLDSSAVGIRTLGMVVGECLSARMDLNGANVQMTKVLLHMEDKFSVSGFLVLRQAAMVALTAVDSVPVTQFLTTEFYSLNYSLRQRLDILEVLALAAQELSKPAADKITAAASELTPYQSNSAASWRQEVEKRIQNKTKRISKGSAQPGAGAAPNRYAPVAGYFFFPLLRNYDKPEVTFDLLGSDHLVLGRLIHTLGLFMHLAVNAPIAAQMGAALLDFVWAVRYHADQTVRRGVLFAICSVFLSMPSQALMMDLSQQLMETRTWLADVAEADPDADCRSLAVQSLVLLDQNLKKQLQNPNGLSVES